MHKAISYRSTSIVSASGVKHVQWNLCNLSGHLRECCSAHLIQSFFLLHTGFNRKCHMRQTCQLSQFCCESHDCLTFLTVSRQDSQSHGFLGNILNWNITLFFLYQGLAGLYKELSTIQIKDRNIWNTSRGMMIYICS